MKKSFKKTYAFIDASNIIYGCNSQGWKMDFAKLIKYLKTRHSCQKIFYYAGLDQENKKQLKFYEKLAEFGYILKLVPIKRFKDGKVKGDVDSRMTFELMRYLEEYKTAIVLTGDGDYYWVIEYLMQKRKRIYLLSFPTRTAQELKKLIGSDFANLGNSRSQLQRNDKNEADSTDDSASRYYGSNIPDKNRKVKMTKTI